jgi:hypothetical protein
MIRIPLRGPLIREPNWQNVRASYHRPPKTPPGTQSGHRKLLAFIAEEITRLGRIIILRFVYHNTVWLVSKITPLFDSKRLLECCSKITNPDRQITLRP